ncbi:hypothetical protein Snoj_15030 [Streptomyces nojiriensis]|uniref:Cupin domain-containing protein n=1 Tax=Streptomyces nojiriensis TaxID=66374 RepID=A0ABQ3SHI4_9ACTN|nr:hypothetical protein [Streptomyces nojiriensis]QTI49210.1 hypothetical protein JYK04_07081 [Streptomyces nojiriensis]GGS10557.1 hypothetical protein GCM10010205_45000 [Streptomyces nojiriensis]GHI67585.1 hypothetical protein Snoj_15030 [Streptomyces nojiriensis]
MDMPEEACEQEAPHLREIVLFLSVHLDRAPGVLWPEYDNPAFGDPDDADGAGAGAAGDGVCPAQADRFTAELASLTGLSVRLDRVETAGSAPGVGVDAVWNGQPGDREHLLIHQIAGAVTWQLTGTGECGRPESFQCRLLPGELLYVPARWSRRCVGAPQAQYAVISLCSTGD